MKARPLSLSLSLALSLALAFSLIAAASAHARELPALNARVVDEAGVLDAAEESRIDRQLAAYEQRTGHQMAVVILRSLEGDVLEQVSMRAAEQWRLGDAKRDDGLLVLLSMQDRAARIEVGYGLEGVVTDALASRVIRDVMAPHLASGQTHRGRARARPRRADACSGRREHGRGAWLCGADRAPGAVVAAVGADRVVPRRHGVERGGSTPARDARRAARRRRRAGAVVDVGARRRRPQLWRLTQRRLRRRVGWLLGWRRRLRRRRRLGEVVMKTKELARIEQVVRDVERETAGEIVVVIAPRSASFVGVRVVFSFVVGTLVALLLSQVVDWHVHAGWIAIGVPVFFALAYGIASIPLCTRILAGDRTIDDAVLRAAKLAFIDHGVHATRTRAGVLVFLSLFERRVQVIGDAAVHALVGDAGWAAYAARVGHAMKRKSADDLVTVVKELGATLAKAFPRRSDDVNELGDHVRVAGT